MGNGRSRKSSEEAIAIVQVKSTGFLAEVLEEVRPWVIFECKARVAGRLHVQWEGKRGVKDNVGSLQSCPYFG